ncbi:hypothetical protein ST21_014 [Aeromonas phage ST21]|uniref:Uncharacterized protein n=1 Tax=Aeromonas phage ST21 TaxID=3065691 RepID=A0AA96EVE5_9CAUD|nr:hypothetical protein ST21_014 [Aeromonas phage ST21]
MNQVLKYPIKWCTLLVLGLTAVAAILLPGLAIYAKVDSPAMFFQLTIMSAVIIAACIFLSILLLEWKP